jgi:hypothetical protein
VIDTAERFLGQRLFWHAQIGRSRDAGAARTLPPRILVLARVEQKELEPFAETFS